MAATTEMTKQVNIRLSNRLLSALDAEAERRRLKEPGVTITRTDVIRKMLEREVALLGAQR